MGGNWKLNPKTVAGATLLAGDLAKLLVGVKDVDVCVFPAHPHLAPVQVNTHTEDIINSPQSPVNQINIYSMIPIFNPQEKIKGSNIALGGQNCYFMSEGAYTGAVSTCMLKDIGVKYVLAGLESHV